MTQNNPRPEDVSSVNAIITALYEVVSGPPVIRDWDRMRSLFIPGARLIPTRRTPDGSARAEVLSVEEFIVALQKNLATEGFYEVELSRHETRFGHITNVLSAYACRRTPGEEPFMRGVNHLHLLFDGARFGILTVCWDIERPGNPLPTF